MILLRYFSQDDYQGRLLLACVSDTNNFIFFLGTVANAYIPLNPWNEEVKYRNNRVFC